MEPIDIEIMREQGKKLQMILRYVIYLVRQDILKNEDEGEGKEIALKLFIERYDYNPNINSFPTNFYEENKDIIDDWHLKEANKFFPLLMNKLNELIEKKQEKIQLCPKYAIYLVREEILKNEDDEVKAMALKLFMEIYNYTPSIDSFPANFYEENKELIDNLYRAEMGDKFCPPFINKLKERSEQLNKDLERRKLFKDFERNKVRRELLEKERRKQLQNEVYKQLVDEGHIKRSFFDSDTRREPIPQDVMDKVWNRDSGRCVKCSSQENLEFDHIIPLSKGGATSYRNIQILCKRCNIEKSNKIG